MCLKDRSLSMFSIYTIQLSAILSRFLQIVGWISKRSRRRDGHHGPMLAAA